jgi:hypothetical protein
MPAGTSFVAVDDRRDGWTEVDLLRLACGTAEPDPGVAGRGRRGLLRPPRREVVRAADAVEAGELGCGGLLQELVGLKPLVR